VLRPALNSVSEMIVKEEEILLPMSLDNVKPEEWLQIHRQSPGIGFCLVPAPPAWEPEIPKPAPAAVRPEPAPEREPGEPIARERGPEREIALPSGAFSRAELTAVLNALPVDITFVDTDDRVRYFSEGRDRIFTRARAVIGREVRNCHPPKSLAAVEQILADFKAGRQERAAFWIDLGGKFVHIEYFALRDEAGTYLGTLEMSQDLTAKKKLKGERRLPAYEGAKK